MPLSNSERQKRYRRELDKVSELDEHVMALRVQLITLYEELGLDASDLHVEIGRPIRQPTPVTLHDKLKRSAFARKSLIDYKRKLSVWLQNERERLTAELKRIRAQKEEEAKAVIDNDDPIDALFET